jgi:hypothetical protein
MRILVVEKEKLSKLVINPKIKMPNGTKRRPGMTGVLLVHQLTGL